MHICDPCCQNETLLCTWSNLGFWYNIKVYIFPFIMVFEFLKSDNPTRSYAYLNIVVVESIKWRNWLSKFGVCKRANFQCVCGTSTKMEIFGTYIRDSAGSKIFGVRWNFSGPFEFDENPI